MLEFLDTVISDILFKAYEGVKERTLLLSKNKNGIKKYLLNLSQDLDELHLHRLNHTKSLSNLFIDIKLSESIISERYFPELTTEFYLNSGIRNPRLVIRKEIYKSSDYKTKEEIIDKNEAIVLLGQPGSGKTTTLRKIILDKIKLETKFKAIPVYLPLRSSKLNKLSIKQLIITQFEKYGIEDPLGLIERLLDQGSLLIVLDGLDEVKDRIKGRIIEEINDLSIQHKNNTILVSSRLADYQGELSSFKEIEIHEFSKEDIENFIKKWFSETQIDIESLLRKIKKNPQIIEIGSTPLILSLICVVYQFDLDISGRKTSLYKRCIECLLRDWDTQRNFRRDSIYSKLDDPKKINILSELAYKLHDAHIIYFNANIIDEILSNSLQKYGLEDADINQLIEEIKSHYGFIVEVTKDVFSFSHLTFQEYFAANFIATNVIWKDVIDSKIENPFWQEVIILTSSILGNASEYIEYLKNKNLPTKRNLILAGYTLSVDPIVEIDLKRNIVSKILNEYHNGSLQQNNKEYLRVLSMMDETFIGNKLLESLCTTREFLDKIRREN